MAIQYNTGWNNVDFESMNGEKVGDAFIEFIRELSIKCKNNGVVLFCRQLRSNVAYFLL